MNSAWTRRGIVLTAVVAFAWMSGGISERWFGQTLAAPEGEQPKVPATTVAMMDIAYIFKNHKAFNKDMKALEQEASAFQQHMQATDAQLKLLKARMEQTEDKAEKEKLEATLATQGTEFQLSVRKTQTQIAEREARLYYEAYMLLQEETKKYSQSRGIHVVLKFNRDPINPSDRKSVMEGLARPIIFSDAPDISEDILKAMDLAANAKAARVKTDEGRSR
jgi:Skp family chaperone for outer membrane proteins